MAKATKLKLMRRFGLTSDNQLVRRAVDKPQMKQVNVGDCAVCGNPLMVAMGQHIRFHKECRKEGRERYGRVTKKVIEVGKGGVIKKHE